MHYWEAKVNQAVGRQHSSVFYKLLFSENKVEQEIQWGARIYSKLAYLEYVAL